MHTQHNNNNVYIKSLQHMYKHTQTHTQTQHIFKHKSISKQIQIKTNRLNKQNKPQLSTEHQQSNKTKNKHK